MNKQEVKAILIKELEAMVDSLDWSDAEKYDEVCTLELRRAFPIRSEQDPYTNVELVEIAEFQTGSDDLPHREFRVRNEVKTIISPAAVEKTITHLLTYLPERVVIEGDIVSHTITRDFDPDYDTEVEKCSLTESGVCEYPETPCTECNIIRCDEDEF